MRHSSFALCVTVSLPADQLTMSSAAAAAAAASSASSSVPRPSLSLAQLIVPQRHSSKIHQGLLTGQQSVIHADPHHASLSSHARLQLDKYHDDVLEVDDVSITFTRSEYLQHVMARLLAHHMEQQQRDVCEQHTQKQQQLDPESDPVDLARLDAHLVKQAERRVEDADQKRQADARTKRKESIAAERKTKKARVKKETGATASDDAPSKPKSNGKPKRAASDGKIRVKIELKDN